MDAVLQIFKRSICPGTPFFESLAKKPPTTMDDLFRRANKYSMLEDDVRAATQQVLVAGRPSRSNAERNTKPPDRPKPRLTKAGRAKVCPTSSGLDPLRNPSTRDRSRRCAFHKDHGHTTETCRAFQYLVERLIKAGHLKQYLRSDNGGRDASQHHNPGAPRAPAAPKAVINYINGGPSDEEYDSRRKTKIVAGRINTRTHQFHPAWANWRGPRPIDGQSFSTSRSHPDTATTSRRPHLVPGNWGLRCAAPRKPWTNPIRIQRVFNYILGDIVLPVQAGPVTLNVQFSVVQELSPFNVILGRTWLHYMKAIPSTYHQMVSFLTNDGQIDLYGSQLAARQCYQIAREAGANQEDASPPEPSIAHDQ
ncbi:hypothetical protein CK203_042012 [Vitis vinifera]|uniref:Uncharacterized protein n=1 Tax=Vitis vinifera TaxID=29760 RepID=A0A438I0Q0_VITVI|nr:hypothetical protein CK203_042012 [Vitis vinifera]